MSGKKGLKGVRWKEELKGMSWEPNLKAARGGTPDAAARVLGYAAGFLRRDEVLPKALADHIAGAFEAVALVENATDAIRGQTLLRDLGLAHDSGRPQLAPDPDQVFMHYVWNEEEEDYPSETQFVKAYALKTGVGISTVWSKFREGKKKVKALPPGEIDDWFKDRL